MTSPQHNKRREMDVMKLLMSDWKVQLVNESTKEFEVDFSGPSESPYEGGVWKVRVELPDNYPYKSPSIGFKNRIYHPNVDESAGSVCLDVINQTWSPMFDLVNVFEVFLPQLLLYPNPSDPLNGEAAALMLREPDTYKAKIKDYVQRYAMGHVKASAAQRSSSEQTAVHAARAGTPARQSEASQPGAGPANTCAEAEASGAAEPAGSASQDHDDLLGLLSDSEDDV